jgi:hypothetical protein
MSWRFTPWDFEVATQTRERYGAKKMAGLQLQDWGVTYDEMEPFYDRFERIAGTSGYAGNLNGENARAATSLRAHANGITQRHRSKIPIG